MKPILVPISRWMDKEKVVYVYDGISYSFEKHEIMPCEAT